MVNRVQTNRLTSIGQRPPAGTRAPGELFVNFPDQQLGVIDETQNPTDLIAVRFFSPNTNYKSGDVVWNDGHLWHASQDVSAGAFNPAEWDQSTTNSGTGAGSYLPLTGGTMVGALELAGDPTGSLGAATKQYTDKMLPLAGGTMTGDLQVMTTPASNNSAISRQFLNLTLGGYLPLVGGTITGSLNVNGPFQVGPSSVIAPTGHFGASGPTAGYYTSDRGNSGGNITQYGLFYRDANITRLGNSEIGDVMQWNPQGNMQVNYQLTVAQLTTLTAGLNVTGTANITGTGNYPLNISAPAGYNAAIGFYNTGQPTWFAGSVNNGYFLIFNGTSGVESFQASPVDGSVMFPTTVRCSGQFIAQYTSHYPITVDSGAGMNGAIQFITPGQESWLCGPLPTVGANTFYIYDESVGIKLTASAGQVALYGNTVLAGVSGQVSIGATGLWDVAGALVVSPQSSSYGAGGGISVYGVQPLSTNIKSRVDATNVFLADWLYGTGGVGSITTDGNNTYYNTTSDARLKDNVRHLRDEVDVGTLIDNLTPVAFEWKPVDAQDLDGNDISIPARTGHGFIAQQLYQHVPHAVHRPTDESSRYWGTDLTRIVPYLVAELQAVRTRLADLEAARPPVNTAPPIIQAISPPPVVGSLLVNNSPGTWSGSPTYTRQWQRNGNMISGATANNYTTVEADFDTLITCRVTATNPFGSVSINSNALQIG